MLRFVCAWLLACVFMFIGTVTSCLDSYRSQTLCLTCSYRSQTSCLTHIHATSLTLAHNAQHSPSYVHVHVFAARHVCAKVAHALQKAIAIVPHRLKPEYEVDVRRHNTEEPHRSTR